MPGFGPVGAAALGGRSLTQSGAGRVLYRFDMADLDAEAADFNLGMQTYPGVNEPSSSNNNDVAVFGWNVAANGTREDATKPTMALHFEREYWIGGKANFEFHLQSIDTAGATHRPLSYVLPWDGGSGSAVDIQADTQYFKEYDGTVRATFDWPNNKVVLTDVYIDITNTLATHALGVLRQNNASYNADLEFRHTSVTNPNILSLRSGGEFWVYSASARDVVIYSGGSEVARIGSGKTIRTTTMTVANLPAAGTAGAGARAFVTDANATTFASIVAGGGSNGVPVYSDGTNWRIG